MKIHKRRKPIAELARELNPLIKGLIGYYHKFWEGGMRDVWNQLNHRLLKWVKWEKACTSTHHSGGCAYNTSRIPVYLPIRYWYNLSYI